MDAKFVLKIFTVLFNSVSFLFFGSFLFFCHAIQKKRNERKKKINHDIFKHYDIEIIKNAIRKGALSNTVIGTSSDKNVNTTAMVKQVNNNLGGIN